MFEISTQIHMDLSTETLKQGFQTTVSSNKSNLNQKDTSGVCSEGFSSKNLSPVRNVNPFGAMASIAGDRSGPWTGWIDPAPV